MRYRLNFSEPPLTRARRKGILRLTASVYALICVVSLVLLFQTYKSRVFIVDVLQERMSTLEEKISKIEPRVLFLENKSAERNRLRKQASLFAQENNRPSIWYARLIDLARRLPENAVLTEISFRPILEEGENKPEVIISGNMIMRGKTNDTTPLDNLRISLLESVPMTFRYSRLQVESNSFLEEKSNTKIVFSLGFYR